MKQKVSAGRTILLLLKINAAIHIQTVTIGKSSQLKKWALERASAVTIYNFPRHFEQVKSFPIVIQHSSQSK